jgi:dTDP-D-glucose 4,6-dehydratase
MEIVKTNSVDIRNLLNKATNLWNGNFDYKLFYHLSTSEVYGSLGAKGFFVETISCDPNSPYSASKSKKELEWTPSVTFEKALKEKINWYLNIAEWQNVTSGKYQ